MSVLYRKVALANWYKPVADSDTMLEATLPALPEDGARRER